MVIVVEENHCPECHSTKVVKHGTVVNVSGKRQRYKCMDCGHTFYNDKGKE